ncbi:scarecrow-like protein 3 [Miscanthus floridulus]|uniref:scarecrow-like protein 3 n=1 Tax=Miscanthus floridulus TaxID=154761 RepID=UPI00345A733D
MSLENSNSKGKPVIKEEVSPLTPVEQKPFAVMSNLDDKAMLKNEVEEVSLPILETAAPHHHQTPTNDVSGSDDNNGVLGGTSGVQDVGSSSASASASAAHMMQQAAMQWGAVAAPTVILPAFQQLDSSRILLIKEVMQHCVTALATGDVLAANTGLVIMSTLASADGDPLQRVAFAFAEALGRRALQQMLPGLYGGLLQLDFPSQPAAIGYTGATRLCFDALCPLLRVAASVANHAIVTAMEGEEHVHVVDLGGASPNQWLELLHLFAVRPEGKPSSLRLTVVSEEEGLLSCTAWLLHREAARLHITFTFNPVRSHIDRLSPHDVASFGVHGGEALAITSTLQLHRLIADVTNIDLPAVADHQHHGKKGKGNKQPKHQIIMADALLRVLCDLSPKLMVLTEQEAYHNGASLGDRVRNAFDYYAALFNDLEAGGAPRESADRAAVERMLLRQEIMDIVARDGSSRRERHESVMGWAQRMGMAGFRPMHLQVRRFDAFADPGLLVLQLSLHGTLRYWVAQDNTCFIIYANMTPMFSVTAWRPATTTGE